MKKILLLSLLLTIQFQCISQGLDIYKNLFQFRQIPKEVVYLHLNKSTYLKGEQIAFSAYIQNKYSHLNSPNSSNLYVEIRDEKNNPVKQEMILIEEGKAYNTFEIDSSFTSGIYTITAFTNWMKNFDEHNFFQEKIIIADSNLDPSLKNQEALNLDAQFLPESGHFLSGIINNVGIIVKSEDGYGASDAMVMISDNENNEIAEVKLDQFGIGKFSFIPQQDKTYKALINFKGRDFFETIKEPIEEEGIILSVYQNSKSIRISAKTNEQSTSLFKDENFTLVIQNKDTIHLNEFNFESNKTKVFIFAPDEISPGLNSVSLFDSKKNPIAERLFFNFKDFKITKFKTTDVVSTRDSIELILKTENGVNAKFSASILPQGTSSYNRHQNIISSFLINPFIKNPIENAGYYFKNIDRKKQNDLDNLLITQGWSSYDWESIFNHDYDTKLKYDFEEGILVDATIKDMFNQQRPNNFILYNLEHNETKYIQIDKGYKNFTVGGIKPFTGEKMRFSRIRKNNQPATTQLELTFKPNRFPDHQLKSDELSPYFQIINKEKSNNFSDSFDKILSGVNVLDEVKLVGNKKEESHKERERRLAYHSYGRVDVLTKAEKNMYGTFERYLKNKIGIQAQFTPEGIVVQTGSPDTTEKDPEGEPDPYLNSAINVDEQTPGLENAFYLDDVLLLDTSILYQIQLQDVDYIEFTKRGMGSTGFIGNNLKVKIYTNFKTGNFNFNQNSSISEYEVPIAFSANRRYYTPKYPNTSDQFYKEFGVIDWKPDLKTEEDNSTRISFPKPEVPFTLYIEGIADDGSFIYQEKLINLGSKI